MQLVIKGDRYKRLEKDVGKVDMLAKSVQENIECVDDPWSIKTVKIFSAAWIKDE